MPCLPIRRRVIAFALAFAFVPGTLLAQDASVSSIGSGTGFFRGSATAYGGYKSDYRATTSSSGTFSVSASRGTAISSMRGDGRSGALKMELITNEGFSNQAFGGLEWTFSVRFEHTGLGYLQPVQLFLDGVFATPDDERGGSSSVDASVAVYAPDDDLAAYERLEAHGDTDVTKNYVQAAVTSFFMVPAGKPGTWSTYTFVYALNGSATDGWDANFMNTMHAYLPVLAGHQWDADDALAEQARPAWAANQTVPGEALPAVVPEPATLVLVGGGLALFAVAGRRQRAGQIRPRA